MRVTVETVLTLQVKDMQFVKKRNELELDSDDIVAICGSFASHDGLPTTAAELREVFDHANDITSEAAWDAIAIDVEVLLGE